MFLYVKYCIVFINQAIFIRLYAMKLQKISRKRRQNYLIYNNAVIWLTFYDLKDLEETLEYSINGHMLLFGFRWNIKTLEFPEMIQN